MKYQEESTNVSIVSVSRFAGPPQLGQNVFTHHSMFCNGFPDWPSLGCSSGGSSTEVALPAPVLLRSFHNERWELAFPNSVGADEPISNFQLSTKSAESPHFLRSVMICLPAWSFSKPA